MIIPSESAVKTMLELMRGRRPLLGKRAAGGYQDRRAASPMTETEVEAAIETIADDGGIVGVLPGKIDQSVANDSTSNVTLGATSEITAAFIKYHATRSGSTIWGKAEVVILDDGSTVDYIDDPRIPSGESGIGLTIAGDISGGNLRLNLTTDASGGACDFRATYITIEP